MSAEIDFEDTDKDVKNIMKMPLAKKGGLFLEDNSKNMLPSAWYIYLNKIHNFLFVIEHGGMNQMLVFCFSPPWSLE